MAGFDGVIIGWASGRPCRSGPAASCRDGARARAGTLASAACGRHAPSLRWSE
ncbi:hypothetical protein [Streptosporangium carneum]|uniref:hypothetical protein n=1 Tax=Streptosporangium carneum TaxID=47481 RepID=UPI0022F31F92|nr:hypothetical protein [Streptosporangium carneum]